MDAPIGGDEAKSASVMLRDLPRGTIMVNVATAFGMIRPPPIPVSARTRATVSPVYIA